MTAKNDVTGDSIKTKHNSRAFQDGFDRIFRKQSNTVATKKESTERSGDDEPTGEHVGLDRVGLYGEQGGIGNKGDDAQ